MIRGELKAKVYQFYENQISKVLFEQWVYDHAKKIELQLSEEDFIIIVGPNFKSKFAKEAFFSTIIII